MASDATLPQETIRRKREGETLAAAEIGAFVRGLVDGGVTEGQAAAFAMAVYFRGMDRAECVALTDAMARSGAVLDWSGERLPGPVVDKHSTGGVGDKVSLILAPLLAACGAFVPMISGRGLGHTGGTLDKLDAIPGYRTAPDIGLFRRAVRDCGCAVIGQTAELAPADRRLYAIRDVTATVESIPLLTASVLSKKLAAGIGSLVMDVKFGSGAFLPELERARALAESIVAVGIGAGIKTSALLTDMNQALGRDAGNALEVREAIRFLVGGTREPRLAEVTLALGAEALLLSGLAPDEPAARRALADALASGAAAERCARMVRALGGPADLLERPDAHLAAAPVVRPVVPAERGFVAAIDVRALGLAIVALGGGRTRTEQQIDHAVGLADIAGLGEAVGPDRPLALVHARREADAEAALRTVRAAFRLAPAAPRGGPLVAQRIAAPSRVAA